MGIFSQRGNSANRYKKKKRKKDAAPVSGSSFFCKDIAMDLGTANTRIYLKGEGLVFNEPSVVAYDTRNMEVLAVGNEAKSYLGRTPYNIKVVRPLANGVIEDLEVTQAMIREFFYRVQKMGRFFKPKAVVCVPAGITKVEEKAVLKAANEAGIGSIFLIEEPIAAAIGIGLDIDKNSGQMVVNIGGGITDIAVLTLSSVVYSETIRVGGDTMTKALMDHILLTHGMKIGENSAERCKIEGGSASAVKVVPAHTLSGKDALTSIPRILTLKAEEIRDAMNEPVKAIIQGIRDALEKTPPELVSDIAGEGMYLTGGGALLRGIGEAIEKETRIRCNFPADPLTVVINGTGKALENFKFYKKVFV
ncbi:MAG: rod shape-determining protein [Desulfobulbaceae bacterium]|nr:rod shape-determining protein [Desulfobulbaceae bacterium]